MMQMSIFGFEEEILFSDDNISVLCIENKKFFIKILDYLNKKINEKEESNDNEIVIRENGERIEINQNMYLLFDFFNIEYNSKMVLKNLYSVINESLKNVELLEYEKTMLKLRSIIIQEVNELPFEMSMKSDIDLKDILKAFDVKVDRQCYSTVLEKLEFIIDLLSEFKISKILVLPKLKSYLVDEDILELYKYSKYKNIYLLIIEDRLSLEKLDYEKIYYIDNEFCEQII